MRVSHSSRKQCDRIMHVYLTHARDLASSNAKRMENNCYFIFVDIIIPAKYLLLPTNQSFNNSEDSSFDTESKSIFFSKVPS